ncbi:MAG TPA: non-ribosomal peptide synthetase [Jatrophihabitans sp.]|nr:non-ribosomal peptide synthetase [Jatrophihabitans sp.]
MTTSIAVHPVADPGPDAPSAHRLLACWAREAPDALGSVGIDGASLSWRQIVRSVDGLAEQLALAGVRRGDRVGLMAGRTRYALSTLLAAWSCGAVAVLLDERHPIERRRHVLTDAGCRVLVSSEPGASAHGLPVLDPAGSEVRIGPARDRWQRRRAEDEAYVVYTSGTTGRPKGVLVSQANLENFLAASAELRYRPGSRAISVVSPGFDGWLWSVLTPFANGVGCVAIDAEAGDLERTLAAAEVDNLVMTPTLYASVARLPRVEVAVVAGERCPAELARRLAESADRVINVYGPTETTIAATMADTARGDDLGTIGRPLHGYEVEVVGADLLPVPAGTEGEILIGGAGVSLGYADSAGRIGDRFVLRHDRRWYRSGDLGVLQPDGQLRCLGRIDNQVKVGGFRVEFEEVESLARQVDGVAEAVAYLDGTPPTLALGVLLAPGTALDQPLRERITATFGEHLPRQLCPTFVHQISAVPIEVTGKVARRLVAEAGAALRQAAAPAPAETALAGVLAVWDSVFGRAVTEDADFFALGGHSLLAAQLASQLGQRFEVQVSIADVLVTRTPQLQALRIDELRSA